REHVDAGVLRDLHLPLDNNTGFAAINVADTTAPRAERTASAIQALQRAKPIFSRSPLKKSPEAECVGRGSLKGKTSSIEGKGKTSSLEGKREGKERGVLIDLKAATDIPWPLVFFV